MATANMFSRTIRTVCRRSSVLRAQSSHMAIWKHGVEGQNNQELLGAKWAATPLAPAASNQHVHAKSASTLPATSQAEPADGDSPRLFGGYPVRGRSQSVRPTRLVAEKVAHLAADNDGGGDDDASPRLMGGWPC
jgi:hypothetical protein